MGPILVKKILSILSHFTKNCKKIVKSAIFEEEKHLEMGPDLQKFQKKKKTIKINRFLREKNP